MSSWSRLLVEFPSSRLDIYRFTGLLPPRLVLRCGTVFSPVILVRRSTSIGHDGISCRCCVCVCMRARACSCMVPHLSRTTRSLHSLGRSYEWTTNMWDSCAHSDSVVAFFPMHMALYSQLVLYFMGKWDLFASGCRGSDLPGEPRPSSWKRLLSDCFRQMPWRGMLASAPWSKRATRQLSHLGICCHGIAIHPLGKWMINAVEGELAQLLAL